MSDLQAVCNEGSKGHLEIKDPGEDKQTLLLEGCRSDMETWCVRCKKYRANGAERIEGNET